MSMERGAGAPLFRAVCLLFSALLLVLSLLAEGKTAAVNDRAAALEREIRSLKTENEILLARCESSLSLAELERYATEELGLQGRDAGQIVVLEAPGPEG